jgi:hypothetical protein
VRDAANDAGFDDEVADLLADAAAAVDATFSVTYAVEGGTVVVTQRPPDRRVETTSADGTVDVVVTVDGTTSACTDPPGDDDAVQCDVLGTPPPTGVFDDAAVAEFTDALVDSAATFDLAVEEDELVGTPARCLVTEPPSARLCIADTGAILLVERPAGTLRATAYTTDVADDAFVLPS